MATVTSTVISKTMKPLIVLLVSFFISLLILLIIHNRYEVAQSGSIAMSVMLAFTAIGHFIYPKGMTMMLPKIIPFKLQLIYATGFFEILAAISLLVMPYKILTAWLLIFFFVLILPANIYAANKHVDFEKVSFDGKGAAYLWFRIPLQVFFILWIYFSAIVPLY